MTVDAALGIAANSLRVQFSVIAVGADPILTHPAD
jgi:hypothetical protein